MHTLHKVLSADLKALPEGVPGDFKALVSVFGNVDAVGDRVMPGAFEKSLDRWRNSGDPIPVVLAHQWDDVWSHIGTADPDSVKETPHGLMVDGKLDIEDNPVAAQVHKLMQRRSLKSFSFGYTVSQEKRAKDGTNELHEVDIIEVGPCLKGANPQATLLGVKSMVEAGQDFKPETLGKILDTVLRLEKQMASEDAGHPEIPEEVVALGQRLAELELEIRS